MSMSVGFSSRDLSPEDLNQEATEKLKNGEEAARKTLKDKRAAQTRAEGEQPLVRPTRGQMEANFIREKLGNKN